MIKIVATAILTTIILPIIAWAGVQIFELSSRVVKIESDYSHIRETLIELKSGQNEIKSYIINKK